MSPDTHPPREPGTCKGCWHLPPTVYCTGCWVQVCPHCRHDTRLDLCDGCGSEARRSALDAVRW